MASEEALYYGDYAYDYTNFDFIEDLDFVTESGQRIKNILAKIDKCNYVREDENTGTETRNQTINKEDTIKRVDRKSACGIGFADWEEAVDYVQAGFQIAWKISNSLYHLVLKAHL